MAAGGQKPSSNHRHKASSRFAQRQQRYAERWEQGSDTNTCTQNKDKWPTYCACFSEVRNFTTRLDKRSQHKTTGRIYTEHIPKRKIRIEFPDKILNFIYRCRRLVRFSCTALRVSVGAHAKRKTVNSLDRWLVQMHHASNRCWPALAPSQSQRSTKSSGLVYIN